jgi:hypothetical protein
MPGDERQAAAKSGHSCSRLVEAQNGQETLQGNDPQPRGIRVDGSNGRSIPHRQPALSDIRSGLSSTSLSNNSNVLSRSKLILPVTGSVVLHSQGKTDIASLFSSCAI